MRREFVFFVLGVLVAAALLPATVSAATALFKLQGSSGTVAQVDPARQLMVAQSDPSAFFTHAVNFIGGTNCVVIDARPSTKALVVNQVRIQVSDTTLDSLHSFYMFPNKTCTGSPMLIYQPSHLGSDTETLEPGYPIKASGGVSGEFVATNSYAVVQLYGYTVPAAAIP
jgi:hypothetical protein